jgi:hypothetical protein
MNYDFLILGLSSATVALLFRTLPWPAAWKRRKPLSCAVCLSTWSALLVVALSLVADLTILAPYEGDFALAGSFLLKWFSSSAIAIIITTYSGIFVQPFDVNTLPSLK